VHEVLHDPAEYMYPYTHDKQYVAEVQVKQGDMQLAHMAFPADMLGNVVLELQLATQDSFSSRG
jgi:hypothetical protein